MESLFDHYPVYEANQVLTSGHLNDAFEYLEQQERLTRSHLVGIGIVCGLEVTLAGSTITLSKGCGVTSEGYLVVVPEDRTLVAYNPYTLPPDVDYPQFKYQAPLVWIPPIKGGTPPLQNAPKQFALWELFEDGVPNTTPLSSAGNFLDDKAVLLFLELKKGQLRNCSPNNCDDKGSQVTATLRCLLIARSDLDMIIAAADTLGSGLTTSDLDSARSARLNLPDLRLRRFDVVNSNPVSSNDVYAAFLEMVRADGLAQATANALSAAYQAFRPLLAASYPTDPFAGFGDSFGFMDSAPATNDQVVFLQYYTDFFDDLLCAYDEFRWKALDLFCACCPDDGLYPRHLMLGLLSPGTAARPEIYRQGFLPSPALGSCVAQTKEVLQLFARLVGMITSFTDAPTLPATDPSATVDSQIRITPSMLAYCDDGLAAKAIPYYYAQSNDPPLYQLWSPTKTRRNRANQNFSYNSDLYANPAAPAFITNPLRYGFGPRDFLRIEGHLGKDYQTALRSLLTLKAQYRLPIDVVALRTGGYEEGSPVDLSQEAARFQDLDAVYLALRGDLMAALAEGIRQLYDKSMSVVNGLTLDAGTPKLPLLTQYAPQYGYSANTVGAWYEHYLTQFETQPYIQFDPNAVTATSMAIEYCRLFAGTLNPDPGVYPDVVAIYYISKLAECVPPQLALLNYSDFNNKYQELMSLIRYLRSDAMASVTPDLKNFLPEEEFIDLCEGILFGCKLDAIAAVYDDYVGRINDLRKRQILSGFLQDHPGIQHKAGVPLGGTFVLVYHTVPAATGTADAVTANFEVVRQQLAQSGIEQKAAAAVAKPAAAATPTVVKAAAAVNVSGVSKLMQAIGNIRANRQVIADTNVQQLIGWLTGQLQNPISTMPLWPIWSDPAAQVIAAAVGGLADGTVIADFFLPYQISCDCPGVQYVLPKVAPTVTIKVGCTAASGSAAVTIQAKGAVPPYDISIDGGAYRALGGALQLDVGAHSITVRDADGAEAQPQNITIPATLAIGAPSYTCANGQYTGSASISGGVPPYQSNGQPLEGTTVGTAPTASGVDAAVTVTDSNGCTATMVFNHACPPPCTLPCGGIALNRGYRFFIPDPDPGDLYQSFTLNNAVFTIDTVDLSADVAKILQASADQLSQSAFPGLVDGWIKAINGLIASNPQLHRAGVQWLTLSYHAEAPGMLGMLMIEAFNCQQFDIQLNVSYRRASGTTNSTVGYTPKKTSIQQGDLTVSIPAFDGTTTDKCSDSPTTTNLCPVPPAHTVTIGSTVPKGRRRPVLLTHNFTANVSGPASNLTFVWEAQGGEPTMGSGANFSTSFATGGRKRVTLMAFDANGCSARAHLMVQTRGLPT